MGQRQTDSGSVDFEHVHLDEAEIFLRPGPLGSVFATLRPLIAQLIFANIFVGIAEGAFNEAISYTRNHARRWFLSPAETATEDPYILHHYGEFWVALESARMLTDRAAIQLEEAWSLENNLNKFQRGNVAVSVATAKIAAARAGLDITSRMFEVIGARGTAASLGLDRYWRNLRTHTLHDPIEYKLREVGDWSLNEHIPTPSFYS
jgi:alkylation response protein AidB-like acyl-CoA dehydrogenase